MSLAQVVQLSLWRSMRRSSPPPARLYDVSESPAVAACPVEVPVAPASTTKIVALKTKPARTAETDAWDPEPVSNKRAVLSVTSVANDSRPRRRDDAIVQQEIAGCKQLLLELLKRAAFDLVLYRTSRRMAFKALADSAYRWLFVEAPGTADWQLRVRDGKIATSFLEVCLALDLDPVTVRSHIRKLEPRHVTSIGRPSSYRKRPFSEGDGEFYALPAGMAVEPDHDDGDTLY